MIAAPSTSTWNSTSRTKLILILYFTADKRLLLPHRCFLVYVLQAEVFPRQFLSISSTGEMITVGVAGGTAGLGRAIVETLLTDGAYQVVILSRRVRKTYDTNILLTRQSNDALAEHLHCQIQVVDYTDIQQTCEFLEKHKIEVLISTINFMYDPSPELALIRAATMSTSVKRYIPSIWASWHYGTQ